MGIAIIIPTTPPMRKPTYNKKSVGIGRIPTESPTNLTFANEAESGKKYDKEKANRNGCDSHDSGLHDSLWSCKNTL